MTDSAIPKNTSSRSESQALLVMPIDPFTAGRQFSRSATHSYLPDLPVLFGWKIPTMWGSGGMVELFRFPSPSKSMMTELRSCSLDSLGVLEHLMNLVVPMNPVATLALTLPRAPL